MLEAYYHPAVAVAALLLALVTFRLGLTLRERRLRRRAQSPTVRLWHARLGLIAAVLWASAFVMGPLAAVAVRNWQPFATTHAWLGLAAAACMMMTALLGYRLKRNRLRQRQLHTAFALLTVMLGLSTALFGLELLP